MITLIRRRPCQPPVTQLCCGVMKKFKTNAAAYKELRKSYTLTQLGAIFRVSRQAVKKWGCIPIDRVIELERATGIPRECIAPEWFRGEPPEEAT